MKKLLSVIYGMPILSLWALPYGCGSKESSHATDSIYSVEYISTISITEPEKALAILDTAEQRAVMGKFDDGLADMRKTSGYTAFAYILSLNGEDEEALEIIITRMKERQAKIDTAFAEFQKLLNS